MIRGGAGGGDFGPEIVHGRTYHIATDHEYDLYDLCLPGQTDPCQTDHISVAQIVSLLMMCIFQGKLVPDLAHDLYDLHIMLARETRTI